MKVNIDMTLYFNNNIEINDDFINFFKEYINEMLMEHQGWLDDENAKGEKVDKNLIVWLKRRISRLYALREFPKEEIESAIKITLGEGCGTLMVDLQLIIEDMINSYFFRKIIPQYLKIERFDDIEVTKKIVEE